MTYEGLASSQPLERDAVVLSNTPRPLYPPVPLGLVRSSVRTVWPREKKLRLLGDPTFLDAFAKLRKAIITFVMSVCLSICLPVCPSIHPSVRPYGTIRFPLHEFLQNFVFEYFFEKFVENVQVSLKSHNKNGFIR
jgi:hypothetical protein